MSKTGDAAGSVWRSPPRRPSHDASGPPGAAASTQNRLTPLLPGKRRWTCADRRGRGFQLLAGVGGRAERLRPGVLSPGGPCLQLDRVASRVGVDLLAVDEQAGLELFYFGAACADRSLRLVHLSEEVAGRLGESLQLPLSAFHRHSPEGRPEHVMDEGDLSV